MIQTQSIPKKPGCYLYSDSKKKVIYIGKAKNLQKRVSSYFTKKQLDIKTQELVKQIHTVDYILTDSETEAILLESQLIKQYKPKYNVELKYNQRYAYIKITDETFPRILTARKKTNTGTYFGPFASGYSRVLLIKTLNEIFQLRTCKTLPQKVCLQYHIGLCSGPCQEKISREDYLEKVKQAKSFLQGKSQAVLDNLTEQMRDFAKQQQFELAKIRRDQIQALEDLETRQKVDVSKQMDEDVIGLSYTQTQASYFIFTIKKGTIIDRDQFVVDICHDIESTNREFIMQYYQTKPIPGKIILSKDFFDGEQKDLIESALEKKSQNAVQLFEPQRGDMVKLCELAKKNAQIALLQDKPALLALQELLHLPNVPITIECFDISNLRDQYIVGAHVQFENGVPNTEQYRKYKIRTTQTQNDFQSMYEVVSRRLTRVSVHGEKAPDLIVIDGGRGQLDAALRAQKEQGTKIPMIGLAKREEEILFPGLKKGLNTKKNKAKNAGVQLLLKIRDYTHRFVISYHRKLRDAQYTEKKH
ncbi:MAG: excinuclease ABC subunit UvrC [Candidatus Woesearchaeota archaeon]